MKISVIIPTLCRDRYLEDVLLDLLNQDAHYSFEIIVMDQNSLPPEERNQKLFSLSKKKKVKWIRLSKKNVYLARNKAVDIAKGEIMIFLDDDIRIRDNNFINKHIQAYGNDFENVAAVCGREVNPYVSEFIYKLSYKRESPLSDVLFFPRNYYKRIETTVLSAANFSIKKKVFLSVNGFDERFKTSGDADLALRLNKNGFKIIYDPQPKIMHFMEKKGGLCPDNSEALSYVDKSFPSIFFYLKYIHKKHKEYSKHYIYWHILRKTLLLKSNLLRPWRLPAVFFGLVKAFFVARSSLADNK